MNEKEHAQISKDIQVFMQSRLPVGSLALVFARTLNPQEPVIFCTNLSPRDQIEQIEELLKLLKTRYGNQN